MKWLKHAAHFLDHLVQVSHKNIYLDHHSGDHFDVVTTVGLEKSMNCFVEKFHLWTEILKQSTLTKQEYNRQYKQKKRSNPQIKQAEN